MSERVITGCAAVHPDRRGGQHVAMQCSGVLVIDDERQVGVMCATERSQHGNLSQARALLAITSLTSDEREALRWSYEELSELRLDDHEHYSLALKTLLRLLEKP